MHDKHKSWIYVFRIPQTDSNAELSDLESQLDLTTFKHQTEKMEEDF